jgi:hypothetical protein
MAQTAEGVLHHLRKVLVALAVLFGSLAPAHAQQPPSGGDSNPVKLTRVPNTVTPVETTVPDELLSESARDVRQAFGPGRERLADGFQQSLERAGFDVKGGHLTKDADGSVTFTSGAGEEGPVTITATSSGNTLTLRKIWTPSGPGLKPIVFTQPPAAITTAPLKPPVNANGEPVVLPVFPPDFPRTPGGASILMPFDPNAPPNPNAPLEPFTPPPGWTPVPGLPNIYLPPPSPPTIQDSTTGVNTAPTDTGFNAAVSVTDSGFISGFTLIEGGCDFLDDGSSFRDDLCSTNTPPVEDWPNVMVQVLDQDGFRPPVRNEARVEKMHILGSGGPDLLGRGGDGVIKDLAPATYDDSFQYEVITVRVAIRSSVQRGFNLLRDWLLRGPRAIAVAARSERTSFIEQARSAPSTASAPSRFKARSALSLLLTSTGTSTGEAFRVQALANSPITFDLTSVVAEPLKGVKPNSVARASTMFGARGAATVTATGYCLEFMRKPPSAGMLYRIARPEIQRRFEPLRRVAHAARQLADAGQLNPDSDPKSFVHSIAQWAIWSSEQKFTPTSFAQAFVDHTRKAVEASGRPWQREYAQAVEKAAPGRWQQIQKVLRAAAQLE